MGGIKSHRGKKQIDPGKLEQYVRGADAPEPAEEPARTEPPSAATAAEAPPAASSTPAAPAGDRAGEYPWEAPYVRADISKDFPMPITEPRKLQLDWLVEQGHARSRRAFIRAAIENALDAAIEQHTGQRPS